MNLTGSGSPLAQADRLRSPGLATGELGILRSTLLPSFALHTTLDLAAWAASRATDKAELKDWNWPASQVINAWWSAVGHQVFYNNVAPQTAWRALSWTDKTLLTLVTAWGTRLFARIAARTLRRGADDARYVQRKTQNPVGFWKEMLWKQYLPEAAFLTLISLPFTLPFRLASPSVALDADVQAALRAFGVGLFGAGFALEVLADGQMEAHRAERQDLCRSGVWSIVRHPNYLGDTLVHLGFAFINCATNFNPLVILGPLTNYVFLRFVGGDKMTEASQEDRYKTADLHKYDQLQEWKSKKNSFWPGFKEIVNPWTWAVVGFGVVGVVVEEGLRGLLTK
ncbi:DUF1295 domain protein [Aspergillus indologenus CBS 114.80]|uniref:DUF1295 domain protein n=2 Tax=Aspergillus TaxID=5052 RepID=A0A2V5HXK8_9EURO|nr:DUF1295 domain protein [Aspergillus indologenus CBS 114.80]